MWFMRWLFGRLAWLGIETQIYHVLFPDWLRAQEEGIIIVETYVIYIFGVKHMIGPGNNHYEHG